MAHPPVTKICSHCGKEFTVPYGQRNQKYCSYRCSGEARRIRLGKDKVTIKCAWCGKEFIVDYGLRNRLYCSRQCAGYAGIKYKRVSPRLPKIKEGKPILKPKPRKKASVKPQLRPTEFKSALPRVNTDDEFSHQFIGKLVKI